MRYRMPGRGWFLIAVALVLVGASCGGGAAKKPALSATQAAPTMLSHVPADSPYVFVQLEPIPQAVRDAMFRYSDEKLAHAIELSKSIPKDLDRSKLPPTARLGLAFIDELKGKDLTHWGRELGFDPAGRFALYGVSLWPVLRVGIADAVKLRGVVNRVIVAGGVGAEVRELAFDGRRYWRFDAKGMTILAAVLDSEVVGSIVPTGVVDEMLPFVVGTRRPEHPLSETGRVAELLAAHHFSNLMFGYVDLRAVASILTSQRGGALERPLHDATGPVSGACKTDIERLVAIAPRIVFGYHRLDTELFHASLIAEVAPPILRALQSIRSEVPEVVEGAESKPLFAVGAAAKLDAVLPLARAAAAWSKAEPLTCGWFTPINSALAEIDAAIATPLPPAFQGLRGFSLVVDELRLQPTFDATGSLLLATDRGPDLVALLQQKVPGMSSVTLVPDGRPVALPSAVLGLDPTIRLHAATRADRVAVAVGRTSAQRVRELVYAKTPQHSPLAMFAFDLPRIQALGLVDKEEPAVGTDNMTNVWLQLDAKNDGLAIDVFGTFQKM